MTSQAASKGTCFGFEVHSDLPLKQLRPGTGEHLTVTEVSEDPFPVGDAILKWDRESGHPVSARLHGEQGGPYQLWLGESGWFIIDPYDGFIAIPRADEPRREERLWGLPALLTFLHRGDIPLHAAAVGVGDSAILLAGPSRQGKTTLVAAFIDNGYDLLSGDLSCLRVSGGSASVLPGPAALRVRRDVVSHVRLRDSRVVYEDDDRVHLVLNEARRVSGAPLELAGIVFLTGESRVIELERVDPAEALRDLWLLSFDLPTSSGRARKLAQLARLAERVPMWNMTRPMEFGALDETVETMIARCGLDA